METPRSRVAPCVSMTAPDAVATRPAPRKNDPLTELDPSADLVIHARHIHQQVLADPQRFASAAADVVSRARSTRNDEALVVGLCAAAWAERSRLADGVAKRLLDEAVRVARRTGLHHALADVLTTRAVINQELGN